MSEAPDGAATAAPEDTSAADQVTEQTQAQGDDEQPGDDAPAPETETPEQARKRTARERVEQAVARQREAEREAEFWKSKALQTTPAQPAQEAQHQPQGGSDEPDPGDYEHGINDLNYVRDVARWEARQEFRAEAERERQQQHVRSAQEKFHTRKAALFPEGEPEGLQRFLALEKLPGTVIEVVAESDIGPKIADHLGANPAELRRLEGMSPIQQVRELTRLEMRLSEPAKPTPKTATHAPDPPPQVRGAGGRFTVAPDTDDFTAFEKQYGV